MTIDNDNDTSTNRDSILARARNVSCLFIFESYCFPSNLEFGRDRIELEGTEENSSYYSGTELVPKIQPAILDLRR